ncbi:Regulator of sigma-W protease RasP [Jeotgalibaca dankookensis]|uniref:Zinc metalloprotease n=1 Tax=Jeotgalibaca dankookensis TaxID=708126 RepID=A0A1S6INR0_9LACT|nr:RIP metalloprotease RseP [Jeotgalibaca dankookensis]AQS53187.1 Regulator of sigma-W protease RasP [Jeotgalibaca dankookensis]
MLQTILIFLIIFSILVIIHEFGHFYFAKKAGILVREFAIGMGPKMFSHRKNGTTYTVRIFPLGGYVRMAGYGDDEMELRAGMLVKIKLDDANTITEIDLSDKQQLDGVPMELVAYDLDKDMYLEGNVAGRDGLVRYTVKRDALITEPDGTQVQVAPLDVQFQSAPLLKRMMTNFAGPMNNFILGILVFSAIAFIQGGVLVNESRIGEISPNSPAQEAGLQEGDQVTAINGQEVKLWPELVQTIQSSPNELLLLKVKSQSDDSVKEVSITPSIQTDEDGNEYGQIGIMQAIERSFSSKIIYGFTQTWFIITSIFSLIGSMFTRGFDVNAFGGPVAIYAATEEVVGYGFMSILSFLGYLSVNLGTVNLLPVPALDGGKLLLNLVEGVRGKPLEPEKESIITLIGVVMLLLLMVVITWNDIQRFFFG